MRVLTLNHWGVGGDWDKRREVIVRGLRDLRPDLIAFQEAVKTDDRDSVRELVGDELHVAHQTTGLLVDGNGAAIVSRWPIVELHELDQQVSPRAADFPTTTLVAEIHVPDSIGPLLFVNHLPSWKPQLELERELQTVAAVRFVEELVAVRPYHVVLAGDLDATPDAASIRFLRGLQSLGGLSVCYRDVWEAVHPHDPGQTFTIRNRLVMEDSDVRQERSRRIDYIFVRCEELGPTLEIISASLAFAEPVEGVWASDHLGVVADLRLPVRSPRE